ncbi:MAG TPA: response regulator [Patescibacteria group bacterium]|jgi:CheY-like chemotaxis protein|nr:response regulator [Patescibacteria group bacterium]
MSKILIFDGEPNESEIYHELFSGIGYPTTTVTDMLQLWGSGNEHPDLVFTTMTMPREQGFEMVKQLRNNPATASIPIVMFTNQGEQDELMKNPDLGNVYFMIRGFESPAEVLNKVKKLLGNDNIPAVKPEEDGRTGSTEV